MEEIFLIALNVIFELLAEILIWVPVELLHRRILYCFAGLLLGGISILVFPCHVIPYLWLRIVNLLVTPFLTSLIAYKIFQSVKPDEKRSFWDPYSFVILITAIRFFFAK